MKKLLTLLAATLLLATPGLAQNLTQADFAGLVVPQHLSNGNNAGGTTAPGPRLAVPFRATLTNLAASTLYRFYVQGSIASDLGTPNSGAGNPVFVTPGGAAFTTTNTVSLSTAGGYATFTTNAAGSYTGWFAFLNTANVRFTAGNVVRPAITLALDATPATVIRRALDQTMTVLAFAPAAGATNGTLLRGSSSATARNFVFTYDNVAGTGRPLSGGLIENVGVATGTTQTGANAYTYSTAAGDYALVVPNTLPSGVRRIEERTNAASTVANCALDTDGTWPSGTDTVNPTGGAGTALVLTATDTPLNAGCGATPATPTLVAAPTGPLTFSTATGTASATQQVSVSGSNLTAGATVTASAGYEVALATGGPYSAALVLPATGGTLAATPVFVRLAATATAGTANGTLTLASAGATGLVVTLNGTVTAPATAPTIASFAPASGPVGTTVTVTGTNFIGATGASVNGTAGTNFMVMSATSVMFDVAAGSTSGPVRVVAPGGTAVSSTSFTVTAPAAVPVVTAISPATAPAGAAVTVTITGTGFNATSVAQLNGTAYPTTFGSATSLTFAVPASLAAATYALTVFNAPPAGGTSNSVPFVLTAPAGPVPTLVSLSPARAVVGGPAFTLAVSGTNLFLTTTIEFRGVQYPVATANMGGTGATVLIPATAIATAIASFPVRAFNGSTQGTGPTTFSVVTPAAVPAYEDFEQGTKSGYAAAPVALGSGSWEFANALVGDLFQDRVNQAKSARLRPGGSVGMNFDKPNGAGTVTVQAANYGTDTGGGFKLEISTNGGTSYTQVGADVTTLGTALATFTFTPNQAGPVRLRFTALGAAPATNRINLDDVNVSNFLLGTRNPAGPALAAYPNPTADQLTLALPGTALAARTALVLDLTGRRVAELPIGPAAQVSLRGLPAGTYLLRVAERLVRVTKE